MGRRFTRICASILMLMLLFNGFATHSAFAEESSGGLAVSVRSDKSSYSSGDDVELTVDVKNGYAATVSGLNGTADLPECLTVKQGSSSSWNAESIAPGESMTWTIRASANSIKASKTNKSKNNKASGMPFTGDVNNWIAFAVVGAGLLLLGVFLLRGHRSACSFLICFVVSSSLLLSIMPRATYAEADPSVVDAQTAVFVDGKRVDVVIHIKHDPVSQSSNVHTVAFNIAYPDLIDNPTDFSSLEVKDGDVVKQPSDPKSRVFGFDGWFADEGLSTPFDFSKPITGDTVIYAKLSYDATDTDSDGMADGIERWYGTNVTNADTDGDGLPDGFEIECGTNPLLADSDANGVIDYDEDADSDLLSNGEELQKGTRPLNPDTDNDGISDGEEIKTMGTDPLNADTDGDGALDGWEIENDFDPNTFNSSFETTIAAADPSPSNLVTAGVAVKGLSGSQASSLTIAPVDNSQQSLVSPSIAGYMGNAYEFSVEGSFESAEITFAYDSSTFGQPDEDFRPEIYYVNEQTHCLERVENQSVDGNTVTAYVSHFSTYILLNGVPFDKAWDADIKSANDANDGMAFCFTLDYSQSMDGNDPYYLRKDVTKSFVEKLREEDQGALVSFIAKATVTCPLTNDKNALNQAIDSIQNDSGWNWGSSGTNGTTALKTSLEELSKTNLKNKYILFMTDGEDTTSDPEKTYEDLIADAQAAGVKIYTVALGKANTELLNKIAESTGGKCYEAKAGLDLEDIYKDIEVETVDLFTDSNDDGIPDYYNKLIYEGKLILSNGSRELTGIDFNYDCDGKPSNDWDHDGIKNGDEIQVVTTPAGGVYLNKVSNPVGKNDKGNYFDGNAEEWLLDDGNFRYSSESSSITEDDLNTFVAPLLSKLFGTDQQRVFKEELMSYLVNDFTTSAKVMDTYKAANYVSSLKEGIAMLDNLVAMGKTPADKISGFVSKVNSLSDKLNGVCASYGSVELYENDYYATMTEISSFIHSEGGKATWTINCGSFRSSLSRIEAVNLKIDISKSKLNALSSKLDAISGVFDVVDQSSSLFKLISNAAELGANSESVAESVEWLNRISTHGSYAAVRDSATMLKNAIGGNFCPLIADVALNYAADEALKVMESLISNICPAGKIIVATKEGLDAFFGIGDKYEDQFKLLTMNEGTIASCGLYRGLSHKGSTGIVALSNVANMRFMGETYCKDYKQSHGILGKLDDFFGNNEEYDGWLSEQHNSIKAAANKLHLVMSSNL